MAAVIRFVPAFFSAAAVMFAAGMGFRAHLPWLIELKLVVQSTFALACWWNLCRGDEVFDSHSYRVFFGATFAAVLLVSVGVAIFSWPMNFWIGVLLWPALACAVFLAGLALNAPRAQRVTMIQGGVLIFCGILALIARANVEPPELRYTTVALGFFCTLLGCFFWAYSVAKDAWTLENLLVPPMLGIVCFGWLGFQLLKGQLESARQHSVDELALSELQHMAEAQ